MVCVHACVRACLRTCVQCMCVYVYTRACVHFCWESCAWLHMRGYATVKPNIAQCEPGFRRRPQPDQVACHIRLQPHCGLQYYPVNHVRLPNIQHTSNFDNKFHIAGLGTLHVSSSNSHPARRRRPLSLSLWLIESDEVRIRGPVNANALREARKSPQ